MSIFASMAAPDHDEHEDNCQGWEKKDGLWEFVGPCSCGQPDAPLVYQGSHVLPTDDDERGGYVDLALIPSHITRDGRDDRPEDGAPWPWLRFGVNHETVILTRRNVEQIHKTLGWWLSEVEGEK